MQGSIYWVFIMGQNQTKCFTYALPNINKSALRDKYAITTIDR